MSSSTSKLNVEESSTNKKKKSQEKEKNKKDNFVENWNNPQKKQYKPFLLKSELGEEYAYCAPCKSTLLCNSLYGKSGHL